MAITKSGLFSLQAHGKFGKAICYQTRPGWQNCHKKLSRKDKDTLQQRIYRVLLSEAVSMWRTLSQEQKRDYAQQAAEIGHKTGFNVFIGWYVEIKKTVFRVNQALCGVSRCGERFEI